MSYLIPSMAKTEKDNQASNGKSCSISAGDKKDGGEACSSSVIIVHEGDLCPNCKFAKLVREPGNIIKCPVCGYGTSARYT